MESQVLPIAHLAPVTEAEGPGRRFAIWLQGCPLRCPGCCNPEMLPFSGGRPMPVGELLRQAVELQADHGVEGVTFLGGEPVAHAAGVATLAQEVQSAGLSVMVFSGYTLAQIRQMNEPAVGVLLANTDILVDGPYERDRPERERRWVGSANQVVHFFTDRYRPDDAVWSAPNTLEIRLVDGQMNVNGFPFAAGADFWSSGRFAARKRASA
jgi:anaerobic ribonucleoside-triphosphate reductase activating protein